MKHRRTTWFRAYLPTIALVGVTFLLMLGSIIDWVFN